MTRQDSNQRLIIAATLGLLLCMVMACGKKNQSEPPKQTAEAEALQQSQSALPLATPTPRGEAPPEVVETLQGPDPAQEPFFNQSQQMTDSAGLNPVPLPVSNSESVPTAPPSVEPTVAVVSPAVVPSQVWVFGYHQFQTPKPNPYSITTDAFRSQLQFLRDTGWTVIPLQQLIGFLKNGESIPEKSAVITVDDGYASVFHHAYPLLKEFGYPWAFFCYTDFIGSGRAAITWEQLRMIDKDGCDVQSHTKSHPFLTRKGGKSPEAYDAWLKDQLLGSKEMIEQKLGKKVNALAYSYGAWNDYIRERAVLWGYEALFTVKGQMVSSTTAVSEIGRVIISKDNEHLFSRYLSQPLKAPESMQTPQMSSGQTEGTPYPQNSMPEAVNESAESVSEKSKE